MTFTNSRVLVAGGAGFIGRHLVTAALRSGAEVVVVDDFSSSARDEFVVPDGAKAPLIIEADVAAQLPSISRCDIVFNLASPASPLHYQKDPVQTWRTIVYGTDQLAMLAHGWDAVFVQASTSEVYGDPEIHPQPESYWGNVNPSGVRSCYDEGKRAAEAFIFDMVRERELNARVARIFNTYGPGMNVNDGRLLPNLISQALEGAPLTVFGDGSQTRSLCFVADMVEGLLALARVDAARGETINLGNTVELSVLEIAMIVAKKFDSGATIEHRPLPKDDPTRRRPDISKAQRILGWTPSTHLDNGLDRMAADFQTKRSMIGAQAG